MLPEEPCPCPTLQVLMGLEQALALASEPKINRALLKEHLRRAIEFARLLEAEAHDDDEEGN